MKEGAKAPGFELPDDTGKTTRLADFAGQQLVLYFYPRDATPGCTMEAEEFRDLYSKFKKKGAEIIGISKDSVESHAKFRAKFKLPFRLLADTDRKLIEAYDVWQEKNMYGKKVMGVVRTTVIIGADGKVAKIFSKVKAKGHAAEVLGAL
jgi:peroxiredoxin Q/BCP